MILQPRYRASFVCHFPLFVFLAWSPARPAAAAELAQPVLVADFTPGGGKADFRPEGILASGGKFYFSGSDVRHGIEPWVSDGSPAGTRLLGDLCPGTCWSYPENFIEVGDTVIFNTRFTETLYAVKNGKVEALAELGDPYPNFTRLGGILFVLYQQNYVRFVLRTDGTRAGTRLSQDFCSDLGCIWPEGLTAVGNRLYYWRLGQLFQMFAEGDSRPIAALTYPAYSFTPLDATRIVFNSCLEYLSSCPAWVTDGTSAGTRPLETEPDVDSIAYLFFPWRGRIYYINATFAIVSTDGTPEGTRVESDFVGNEPRVLAGNDDYLLYSFTSDSGPSGVATLLAVDTAGNQVELLGNVSRPELLGQLGSKIFMSYRREGSAFVAVTDGTPTGTFELVQGSASRSSTIFGGYLYFGLDAGPPIGPGLWRTDGSVAGTRQIDLGLFEPHSSFIEPYRVGNALLLFGELRFSRTPWRLDPVSFTAAPVDPAGRSLLVVAASENLLFAEENESGTRPLVAFTGTSLADLPVAGVEECTFGEDGRLYFSDAGPGQKIWESDGTVAGTRELIDFYPGWLPCRSPYVYCPFGAPQRITPSGNRIFFSKQLGFVDSVWVWEKGHPAARPLLASRIAFPIAAFGEGQAILRAFDPEELWISDGTDAGTRLLFAAPTGHSLSFARLLGSRLYFSLRSENTEWLWVSNLASGETERLTSEGVLILAPPIPVGDHVIFRASRVSSTWELGWSDGTPGGTRWLDLGRTFQRPGFDEDPFAIDRQNFVFGAAGDTAGQELWISNGYPAGTHRLTDLAPGAEPSSPNHFALAGRRLFFQANDGVVGRELWALDLPPLAPCTEDQVCLMDGRFEVEVTATTSTGVFRGHRAAGSADSGVFTFFSSDNWEVLVKVLDGCAINGQRWVFAAAATDVGFTLRVIDRTSGAEKVYTNSFGEPAVAVTDTAAFSCN